MKSNLVSVAWLKAHSNDENLIILDASISKVAFSETKDSPDVIPNAMFCDIKTKFSNVSSPYPNTIPSETQFRDSARDLGVNKDSIIVVYDSLGIYSSPRVWWLFKTFGFKNIFVLDGGLPEWKNKNLKTVLAYAKTTSLGNFNAVYNPIKNVFFDSIIPITNDENTTIIDARSSLRFNCEISEPRIGLRSGIIPNSKNLPFKMVLDKGLLKSKTELQQIFRTLTKNNNLIFTCGSGITASILDLAATEAGYMNTRVYDGSWTEFGSLIKG